MPTLNAYKNDPGYYIRAWTSDLGNINYKLHSKGNKILEEFGLSDGDDISWDIIQTLRAAGELYTEQSGTLDADEFIPSGESTKNLSTNEAERLLEVTLNASNLSGDQLTEICDILGIDVPDSIVGNLEQALEDRISEAQFEQFQIEHTLNGDPEVATLSVDIQDVREDNDTPHIFRIGVFLLGDIDQEEPGMARHDVIVCQNHGLETWNLVVDRERSWQKYAEMEQQKSCLLPVVVEWLLDLDIEVGTPDEAFGTKLQAFGE